MTAFQWFQAYTDSVDLASCLMLCTVHAQAQAVWTRSMGGYRAAKGLAYADSVAVQTDALLEGVDAMRRGVAP